MSAENNGIASIFDRLEVAPVLEPGDLTLIKSEFEAAKLDNQYMKEEISRLKRLQFGNKSERVVLDDSQGSFFNESEVESKIEELKEVTVAAHTKKVRGHRAELPENLPRKDVVIEIPESERVCSTDGSVLTEIGTEVSEKLEVIPKEVFVIRTIRKTYACKTCESCLKTANLPESILPKTNCGPGLLAYIVTSKYVDHLPLYRQEAIFERAGIQLPRSTLGRWIVQGFEKLTPLLNLMQEEIESKTYL